MKQGVIFPDVIDMALGCGLAKSEADLVKKLLQFKHPSITGDKLIFRLIRQFYADSGNSQSTQKLKNEFRKLKLSTEGLKLSLSDYKYAGNWAVFKGVYTRYNTEISQDIINLCEKDKNYIRKINGIEDSNTRFKTYLEIVTSEFCISNEIIDPLLSLELINSENKIELQELINKFRVSVLIHQYLKLFSHIENHLYLSHHPSDKNPKEYDLVENLIPNIDTNGKYIGSINKLIINTYEGMGFKSQYQFVEAISKNNMDPETIKKRLNRWKSGSTVTPGKFSDLVLQANNNYDYIPEEIVLISMVFDKVYKISTIRDKIPPDFVILEFNKYRNYKQHPRAART